MNTPGDGGLTRRPESTARRYGKVLDEIAAGLFGDVQVTVTPKLTEHTPGELNAIVRTMSFYARLSTGQRQALEREYEAIYERLGRPIRASTVAALVTAHRLA